MSKSKRSEGLAFMWLVVVVASECWVLKYMRVKVVKWSHFVHGGLAFDRTGKKVKVVWLG